jgi:hypothetical protein
MGAAARLPFATSRTLRTWVERGRREYSAVTHPSPSCQKKRHLFFDAGAQITFVSPNSTTPTLRLFQVFADNSHLAQVESLAAVASCI